MASEAVSRPSRSDRRRARTRAALVAAAREVMAAGGIEAATIQAITDTADVAKGSFYNHFESREDILDAAATSTLDELGAALDARFHPREHDPARVLAASLQCTLRRCSEDPVLGGFVLNTSGITDVAERALGERGRRDLLAGRAAGRFDFTNLEVVIAAIAGGSHRLLRRRLRGELDATAEVDFVALVLRMLGLPAEEARTIAAETAADAERKEEE